MSTRIIKLLIKANVVKESTTLASNIDEKIINNNILAAQKKYLLPLLGSTLFDKILNDVSANTITGDYQTLYDNYIIDTISAYVKYEMVIDLNFTFSNAGTTQNNGQQYRVSNMSELFALKKQFLDNAEVFGEILRKHLEANYTTKFPEYKVVGTSYDAVTATETAYDCSIFLD